jgi:hypothetical protein
MTTVRLIVKNNALYFPFGGIDFDKPDCPSSPDLPALLIRRYDAGDYDTISWPLPRAKAKRERELTNLAYALFDERECNDLFPSNAAIELPDGTEFDVEAFLDDSMRIAWKITKPDLSPIERL